MARRINVKALRDSIGCSIDDLAAKLGVHSRTVSRWENGHTDPSPLAISKLRELQQPEVPTRRQYDPTEPTGAATDPIPATPSRRLGFSS